MTFLWSGSSGVKRLGLHPRLGGHSGHHPVTGDLQMLTAIIMGVIQTFHKVHPIVMFGMLPVGWGGGVKQQVKRQTSLPSKHHIGIAMYVVSWVNAL